VGTATLYRRFPTRESLLALVFEERIGACAEMLTDYIARAEADPWAHGAESGERRVRSDAD